MTLDRGIQSKSIETNFVTKLKVNSTLTLAKYAAPFVREILPLKESLVN